MSGLLPGLVTLPVQSKGPIIVVTAVRCAFLSLDLDRPVQVDHLSLPGARVLTVRFVSCVHVCLFSPSPHAERSLSRA